jgi:hypothetical protein
MANKAEFIQLEAGDDAGSVRDRLSFIRGERVLLIWPEEGTILTRKLDLVLIQREAMRRSIRLSLVTHDPQVVQHAGELNISTFETIGASERGRWKRGRSKVFTNRFQRPEDEPIPDDLKEVASRIYAEETAIQKRWRRIQRIILVAVLLLLTGGLTYVFLPSATVSLTPAQGEVTGEAEIVADPLMTTVDVENRVIPATKLSVQVEDSGTIETSGSQNLGDDPATGSVVFINQTSNEVTIPADTTVITSAGIPIQFRTTQDAILAAGAGFQVEVPIEALPTSAGAIGNVDSGVINTVVGPLSLQVTVRNLAPTTGGASGSERAVTADDKDRLLATVRQQLQARAYVEMEPRLSATQFIILETVHIAEERNDWMTYSANVGDVTDTLSLTMRVVVEATAVDQQFGQQIVYAQMSSRVRQGEFGKAVEIRPESVTYERGAVSNVDSNTGKVTFAMTGSGSVTSTIDTEAVRQELAGRSINDAIAQLVSAYNLQQGTTPQIIVSPDWFGNMPLLPMRINVQLQETPT